MTTETDNLFPITYSAAMNLRDPKSKRVSRPFRKRAGLSLTKSTNCLGFAAAIALILGFPGYQSNLAAFTNDGYLLVVGAAGHSGSQRPYTGISNQDQFNLLKSMGMRTYRSAEFGDVNGAKRYVGFCDEANTAGIEVSILLNPNPISQASQQAAYDYGRLIGSNSDSILKTHGVKYYETGNEYDNRCIKRGSDGASPTDYNDGSFDKCKGMVQGIYDGVKAADPDARVIGGAMAGWFHYGFGQRLWNEGVRWDITVWHFYSDQGRPTNIGGKGTNVFDILKNSFGKPIWISEINGRPRGGNQAMADYVISNLNEWKSLAAKYNLMRVNIYELYDQPGLAGEEANFGLAKETGELKAEGTALKDWISANPPIPIGAASPASPAPRP
jgi:hypothetical protein